MSYHGRCADLSGKVWESVVRTWRGDVIATAEVELGALQAAEQAPAHWMMLEVPRLRSERIHPSMPGISIAWKKLGCLDRELLSAH
ncbi:hypothetical protein F4781DRAFT_432432 [Annulohypoxylon bovei var. microspora]|nr:hypothetical protein F4781DRAFT_432432 [Annulohypoxylon bovei var. microspora]